MTKRRESQDNDRKLEPEEKGISNTGFENEPEVDVPNHVNAEEKSQIENEEDLNLNQSHREDLNPELNPHFESQSFDCLQRERGKEKGNTVAMCS